MPQTLISSIRVFEKYVLFSERNCVKYSSLFDVGQFLPVFEFLFFMRCGVTAVLQLCTSNEIHTMVYFSRSASIPLVLAVTNKRIKNTFMYIYVGPVVWALEKSIFDQILRPEHPRSRWCPPFGVMFARRASPCPSLPTLWRPQPCTRRLPATAAFFVFCQSIPIA